MPMNIVSSESRERSIAHTVTLVATASPVAALLLDGLSFRNTLNESLGIVNVVPHSELDASLQTSAPFWNGEEGSVPL